MDIYCHEESIIHGKIILLTYIIEFTGGNYQAFLWDAFTSLRNLHRCCHLVTLKSKSILVDKLFKETAAEIVTGMAGKSSWDQANRRQKIWFGLEN
jgi:hypothetical protein